MNSVALLLDKCKTANSLASDNAFAARFHVSRQVVHKWRHGDQMPSDEHIAQIARCAGEDPGEWLVRIRAEKASGEAAKAWAALARRLGAAAAVAAVALMSLPATVKAQGMDATGVYIMRTVRRWLRAAFRAPAAA